MISKPTGRSYCSAGRHWMSDRCRHQLVKCPSPSRCPWCDADLQVGGNIRAHEDWCAFGPVPVRPSDALVKERHARGKRQEARLPAPTTLKSGRYRARGRLCIFVILRQTTTTTPLSHQNGPGPPGIFLTGDWDEKDNKSYVSIPILKDIEKREWTLHLHQNCWAAWSLLWSKCSHLDLRRTPALKNRLHSLEI